MAGVLHAYEVELSDGRKVLFAAHKASDLERIYTIANVTGEEPGPLLMHRVAKAGLQISIREVGGEKLDFEKTRARWDELFSFKDQHALVAAWTEVYYGGDAGKSKPVAVTIST
ncbi:MAG TPA: hypothetical protein VEB22_15465 [Phycisphaerales bacterium]|nr:hypothetical protein [Phycisphaerales bacterium]